MSNNNSGNNKQKQCCSPSTCLGFIIISFVGTIGTSAAGLCTLRFLVDDDDDTKTGMEKMFAGALVGGISAALVAGVSYFSVKNFCCSKPSSSNTRERALLINNKV